MHPHDPRPGAIGRLDPVRCTLTPCESIGAAALQDDLSGPERRFDALVRPLPLAGGEWMIPDERGRIGLVERIRWRMPWHAGVLGPIGRQLAASLFAGRPWLAWRPLLMAGPPGSGKSHLAREIAREAASFSAILDLGGTSDSRTLEGTARGWLGAQPCWPALMLMRGGVGNPVLILEEVDKFHSRGNGDALEVLLAMLEPSSAARYYDRCILSEVDLSQVCWVLTCNDPSLLPAALLSRVDVVEVEPPHARWFGRLLRSIVAAERARMGLPPAYMPDFVRWISPTLRASYGRNPSIRRLRRQVADLLPLAPELLTGPRH